MSLQGAVVLLSACCCAAALQATAGMKVKCASTQGDFTIEMTPERGPIGAQRFIDLVEDEFFADVPMFRVVPNFLVQYGIPGRLQDKARWSKWVQKSILDDPHPKEGRSQFKKGDMSFAGSGKDSRTTQVFVAYGDKTGLGGALHETPFGRVIEGMEHIDNFCSKYGDVSPFGKHGPDQGKMWQLGNAYLKENFPEMDYITRCMILPAASPAPAVPVPTTAAPLEAASAAPPVSPATLFAGASVFLVLVLLVRRCQSSKHKVTD